MDYFSLALNNSKEKPCIGFTVSHTPTQVHRHTHTRESPQPANGSAGWYTQPGFHDNRATESPCVCRHSGMEGRRRGCLDGFVFVHVCVGAAYVCSQCRFVCHETSFSVKVCGDSRGCLPPLPPPLPCKLANMSAAEQQNYF